MKKISLIILGILVASLLAIAWVFPAMRGRATLGIAGQSVTFLVANNIVTRYQGLSGESLSDLEADNLNGLVLLYDESKVRAISMRRMEFPLDVVFLNDGKIVSIEQNLPIPTKEAGARVVSSNPLPADMVIELPAGEVGRLGLVVGMKINFGR